MSQILHKQEISLYYKIRKYELLKMADTLRIDYFVPLEFLDELIVKHDVNSDPYVIEFSNELN